MKMIDEVGIDFAKTRVKKVKKDDINICSYVIKKDNETLDLKKGTYKIIDCHNLYLYNKEKINKLRQEIIKSLKVLIKKHKVKFEDVVLVVGLGNKEIIADSLGDGVCKNVLATKMLDFDFINSKICCFTPNVQAVTGINTFDAVFGISRAVKCKLIILVDSLLTDNIKRVGHSFQMSTTGIVPGGAIKDNKEISYKTINIPCLTIGVPFMMDLQSLSNKVNKSVIVAPKDIKYMVDFCSKLIAQSINIVFNQNLKLDEISELLLHF